MNRIVAALVVGSGLAWASGAPAIASADPPPPSSPILSGPVVDPSPAAAQIGQTTPATVNPGVPIAAPIPDRGPLLVVPGVNTPRTGTRAPSRTIAPQPERPGVTLSAPLRDDPALEVGPLEPAAPRYQGPRGRSTIVRGLDPGFSETVPPRVLGSEPIGLENPSDDSTGTSRTIRKPLEDRQTAPTRRIPGIFSRMFPPATDTRGRPDLRDVVNVEPKTDPAADALTKRRIERSIRDSIGDRVRFYEVRVVGREITIRAKAARFWQKRAVRNSLDTLPGLKGYKVVIDMAD